MNVVLGIKYEKSKHSYLLSGNGFIPSLAVTRNMRCYFLYFIWCYPGLTELSQSNIGSVFGLLSRHKPSMTGLCWLYSDHVCYRKREDIIACPTSAYSICRLHTMMQIGVYNWDHQQYSLSGGQLLNHRVGLKVGYKGAWKTMEFCANGNKNNCEVHEEPNYDWFCYIHTRCVFTL